MTRDTRPGGTTAILAIAALLLAGQCRIASADDDAQLIGSRCTACDMVTFPAQDSCPRCASVAMTTHLLPRRGSLWAWTTQGFPPPSPPYAGPVGSAFVPFAVGYVELPGALKV